MNELLKSQSDKEPDKNTEQTKTIKEHLADLFTWTFIIVLMAIIIVGSIRIIKTDIAMIQNSGNITNTTTTPDNT